MAFPPGLFVSKLSAIEFVERFVAMAPDIFTSENVQISFATNVEGVALSFNGVPADALKNDGRITSFMDLCRKQKLLVCTNAALRRQANANQHLSYANEDGIVGRFELHFAGELGLAGMALAAAEKHFSATTFLDLVRMRGDPVETAALQFRERSIVDLEAHVRSLAKLMEEITERETKARGELHKQLEEEHRQRRAELEREHRELRDALEQREKTKEAEFAARETAFNAKLKSVEDREAKHIRRDLLTRLEKELAGVKNETLSAATASKRGLVHICCLFLIALSGTAVAVLLNTLLGQADPSWKLLGPLTASSATLVSTLVYYVKWNDRWFREHADGEFAARRYKADILRASWVAELVSELATEKKGELPSELLDAFTRNLFRDVGTSKESEHPLDSLLAISKRATEVNVGRGSFSLRAAPPMKKAGGESP